MRTTELEAAGRVDQHVEPVVRELRGQQRVDDVLLQIGLDERLGVEVRGVLRRDEDGAELHRHAVLVVEGHLCLPVGAEVREDACLADLGQPVREAVGASGCWVVFGSAITIGRGTRGRSPAWWPICSRAW